MRLRSLDPSLVPPIEASPQLIYSHYGRPSGGVSRRQETLPEPATGRDCSLSTTSVSRRGPPSMPRAELGTALPTRQGVDMLRHATFSVSRRSWASLVFGAS